MAPGAFHRSVSFQSVRGARKASKIDLRQRHTRTTLGSFYTPLKPNDVRQHLSAEGMRAFAEDLWIGVPEINDPHEMPFYDRPEIIVAEITAIELFTYQMIAVRE